MISVTKYKGNTAEIRSDSFNSIRERMSVKNENARFMKNEFASDRTYFITKSGKFECGLFPRIIKECRKLEFMPDIEIDSWFAKQIKPSFDIPNIKLSKLKYDPYDYQTETVYKMFEYGRGTVLIGTGGGKTFIMTLFLDTLFKNKRKYKTLIIVPTLQLIEQTYLDLIDYGISPEMISKWGGGNPFSNTQIIVAGIDILQSENSDLSFLKNIELLIIDEVHSLKKSKFVSVTKNNLKVRKMQGLLNKIVDKVPTMHRFGFTGTLPERMEDEWNIVGKIGDIIYHKPSASLRESKVISQVKINIVNISYNLKNMFDLIENKFKQSTPYQSEIDFLVNCTFRNNIITHIANSTTQNTLVMVDRIEHGELLYESLKASGLKDVYFIQGSVKTEIREKVRNLMESNSNIVCIAISKIFSTGINIKNLSNIIFATPGKAKVKIIQSIGRGLRLHQDKIKLIVYDIADDTTYSTRHLILRKKLYDSEEIKYEEREIRQPEHSSKG